MLAAIPKPGKIHFIFFSMGMLTYKRLLPTLEFGLEIHFCYCHAKTAVKWVEFLKISF